ncbi:DUF2213 domain-containing protein [Acetobacter senegalensis]|uniref:DUF2213 domain-containing protein n=1 Tax=Acetobacter senegalensis TaxID=446692 RepID=UPI0026500C03|nr:DUF2213 domain-containing protein [Acetobacter senegalensis]MDN7355175.1 DUF2213 domain-containing protein [Acetobacter senegalensis]
MVSLHSRLHSRQFPLAYDRSVRRVDKDGHLFVDKCTLSSAIISEYYGWEIPDGGNLGFTRDRLYRLYRDENALKAAASSLNGKPILMDHTAITAENHPHQKVVGSVGSDVRFENPHLVGSLSFWAPEAIEAIQSGRMRSVSAGYRYRALRVAGSHNGERYDGIMTSIHFNHLALVETPRVPDAVIGDSLPTMDKKTMPDSIENLLSERLTFLKNPNNVNTDDFNRTWLPKLDAALTAEPSESSGAMDGCLAQNRQGNTGKLSGVLSPLARIRVLG